VAACLLRPAAARADFTENFDGVTPPNLPFGWSAANASGPAPLWVTTTTGSDSAPNNAFVDEPAVVSDKRFDTPPIPIATNTAVLTFRNNYNMDSGGTFRLGDGGVLEISIDGAAFQDILTAGGSFAGGDYNVTINASSNNPLAGRMVWTGDSGGYITTTVNLPVAAAGKNIVLRFRMGSDGANAGVGWHIDSIDIREDTDGDGVRGATDNCPTVSNANQADADGDGKGDACDNCTDADGDGFGDPGFAANTCPVDNCPAISNADQADSDADGVGDACTPAMPGATCGTCAQGVLPGTLLSLSLMMWGRRRRSRGR